MLSVWHVPCHHFEVVLVDVALGFIQWVPLWLLREAAGDVLTGAISGFLIVAHDVVLLSSELLELGAPRGHSHLASKPALLLKSFLHLDRRRLYCQGRLLSRVYPAFARLSPSEVCSVIL